jgi:DNA-directed RNA polymerase specialized sigma24 family protein
MLNPYSENLSKTALEFPLPPYLNDLYQTARCLLPDSAKAAAAVQDTCLLARGKSSKSDHFQILFSVVRLEQQRPAGMAILAGGNGSTSGVVSALNRVPLEFRTVLLLVDCQGFSYKDAAEILGLGREEVARRIAAGRDRLQMEMEIGSATAAATAH